MKRSFLIAALIASIAMVSSAAAATKKHKAAAARPGAGAVQAKPAADPYAVYVGGEYIGRDPDPNIRASMMRNPHIWDGPE